MNHSKNGLYEDWLLKVFETYHMKGLAVLSRLLFEEIRKRLVSALK